MKLMWFSTLLLLLGLAALRVSAGSTTRRETPKTETKEEIKEKVKEVKTAVNDEMDKAAKFIEEHPIKNFRDLKDLWNQETELDEILFGLATNLVDTVRGMFMGEEAEIEEEEKEGEEKEGEEKESKEEKSAMCGKFKAYVSKHFPKEEKEGEKEGEGGKDPAPAERQEEAGEEKKEFSLETAKDELLDDLHCVGGRIEGIFDDFDEVDWETATEDDIMYMSMEGLKHLMRLFHWVRSTGKAVKTLEHKLEGAGEGGKDGGKGGDGGKDGGKGGDRGKDGGKGSGGKDGGKGSGGKDGGKGPLNKRVLMNLLADWIQQEALKNKR